MVNDRFPNATNYGFEMVDTAQTAHLTVAFRYQSKIYAESNRGDFLQFFGGFTSMRILPVYRPMLSLKPIAASTAYEPKDRRPGLRHVLPVAYGILARAGARAAAEGQNT
jgi:hypothetical protein